MSRLRFSLKFALSGLVLFSFLLYAGYAQLSTLNHRVQASEAELEAVKLMAHLVEWNKVLIESRRITITAQPGDESVRQRFKQQASVIDKKLLDIESEIARIQPFFDLSAQVKGLREGWIELQKKSMPCRWMVILRKKLLPPMHLNMAAFMP